MNNTLTKLVFLLIVLGIVYLIAWLGDVPSHEVAAYMALGMAISLSVDKEGKKK